MLREKYMAFVDGLSIPTPHTETLPLKSIAGYEVINVIPEFPVSSRTLVCLGKNVLETPELTGTAANLGNHSKVGHANVVSNGAGPREDSRGRQSLHLRPFWVD